MQTVTYRSMPQFSAPGASASRWGFAHETPVTALAAGLCSIQADKRNVAPHSGNVWPLSPSGVSSG
jgi:hypothetical protein